MVWAATAVVGAKVVGGVIAADRARKAAHAQEDAAREAAGMQKEASDASVALQRQMYEEGVQRQQPWLDAGKAWLNRLNPYDMPAEFNPNVNLYTDPGYQFRLSEGLKALDRQAAARGGLISGAALKAASRYGQGMASQEYGNAYQRAMDKWNADMTASTNKYNRMASLAGVGQTTAQQIGAAGQNFANSAGNTMMNSAAQVGNYMGAAADARASGYIAQGNALNDMLGAAAKGFGSYMMNGKK